MAPSGDYECIDIFDISASDVSKIKGDNRFTQTIYKTKARD